MKAPGSAGSTDTQTTDRHEVYAQWRCREDYIAAVWQRLVGGADWPEEERSTGGHEERGGR
jgi:hypothetical protein